MSNQLIKNNKKLITLSVTITKILTILCTIHNVEHHTNHKTSHSSTRSRGKKIRKIFEKKKSTNDMAVKMF